MSLLIGKKLETASYLVDLEKTVKKIEGKLSEIYNTFPNEVCVFSMMLREQITGMCLLMCKNSKQLKMKMEKHSSRRAGLKVNWEKLAPSLHQWI